MQVPGHTLNHIHSNYADGMLESWLSSLGTNISRLSKCHVDLDCIRRVKYSPREIRLPLFHLSYPSFRSPGLRKNDLQLVQFLKVAWAYDLPAEFAIVSTRLQTPILTTVLRAVNAIYRDELDIKKFWCTLGSVTVKQDGSGGNVAFLTTAPHLHPRDAQEMGHFEFYDNTLASLGNAMHLTQSAGCSDDLHVCSDTTMPFSLEETGRVRLLPSKPTNVLGDLPSYLEDNIFTRVMNEASRFILDLDDSSILANNQVACKHLIDSA
jgi:hypothetical protein